LLSDRLPCARHSNPSWPQTISGPAAVTEEIEAWKGVYGIEERYKAKLCGKNDGKHWLTQVLDEGQQIGLP
jgi:hypothetical protein